jgi:hypothetical protein
MDLLGDFLPDRVNSELQIFVPDHINDFSFNTPVFVTVDNTTGETMSISPDRDLRVYWLDDGIWTNIRNNVDYLSVMDLIRPQSDTAPGGTIYTVIADFPDQSESIRICITLEANIKHTNSSSKVLAYTEVILSP